MLKRLFILGAAAASAGAAIGLSKARTEFRTWGVDPDEIQKQLPGDELVPEAEAVDTRCLEIAAPPRDVWPWLVQMGYGRGGWYSYDQMDMRGSSATTILPEHQHLAVGDVVPTHPGGGFVVRALEPNRSLVVYGDTELMRGQAEAARVAGAEAASANLQATGAVMSVAQPGEFAVSWAFVLEPVGPGETRLIERLRVRFDGGEQPWMRYTLPLMGMGVFVMIRRQLLGIRERAERQARGAETGTEPAAPAVEPSADPTVEPEVAPTV